MTARTFFFKWMLVLICASGEVCAQSQKPPPPQGQAGFVKWARESLAPLSTVRPSPDWKDLVPLGQMIGDAPLVALSEGIHDAVEPLEFRNRVLQYLVQEKGFTAIAIESGIVEGRAVHDYVRGGPGELPAVLAQGISWTFDRLAQNQDLIRWLREYNADPRHARKINFYGFDVPGSPGNPRANRNVDTALTETLEYLAHVDSASAKAFHARLDALIKNLQFDLNRPTDSPGYDRLSQAERNELTVAVADLITLLERKEAEYTAASTVNEYEWAYRAAIGARQVDAFLRQMPTGWQPSPEGQPFNLSEQGQFLLPAGEIRDRAQADNLDWIVKKEGAGGRILIFAHRYHLSKTPVKSTIFVKTGSRLHPAGTYLQQRFGKRLLVIGNLIGKGELGCVEPRRMLTTVAPASSIEGLVGTLGVPLFLLDLRTAPEPVAAWLNQDHALAHWHEVVPVGTAFDVLFYVDTISACQ